MSGVIQVSEKIYIISTELLNTKDWLSTYLIIGSEGAMLIDPGPSVNVNGLIEIIRREFSNINIKYVGVTHIHLDHGGGLGELTKVLGDIRIFVHPRGIKHLVDPTRLWEASKEVLGEMALFFRPPQPIDPNKIFGLEDNSCIDLGDITIRAIHTPGHAPHHVSYIIEPETILIAGDALGNLYNNRVYPVTVPPFNLLEYLNSINKLSKFNYNIVSVAHFGYVKEEPEVFIQRVKDKAIAWAHMIADLMKSGYDQPADIYRKLLEEDLELRYMVMFREKYEMFKGTSYRAVLGMYQSIKELIGSNLNYYLKIL